MEEEEEEEEEEAHGGGGRLQDMYTARRDVRVCAYEA